MPTLLHFTKKLKPNVEGYNSQQGLYHNIITELQINTDTHMYDIINMSQSTYVKNDSAYVVTTLLIEVRPNSYFKK